uniref:XisI protein n=1 Tax=Hassallia byssoidea TaxID=482630 RepID=UPI000585A0E6|nr:XisI protein [Hassalia byssoidea]
MDRVNQYRQIVQDFLEDFAADDPEAQLIFDIERDRYLVMHNGWRGEYRIYGCAMQLDLISGKVWIQHNSTEIFIDRELISRGEAAPVLDATCFMPGDPSNAVAPLPVDGGLPNPKGIASQDIVLGLRSPKVRERLAAALHTDVGSKP